MAGRKWLSLKAYSTTARRERDTASGKASEPAKRKAKPFSEVSIWHTPLPSPIVGSLITPIGARSGWARDGPRVGCVGVSRLAAHRLGALSLRALLSEQEHAK